MDYRIYLHGGGCMLEQINGANSTSFKSTYVSKSGTTIKSVQEESPTTNDESNQKVEGKTEETKGSVARNEEIKEAIEKINLDERFRRTGCEFTYHEISNRVSITLYDKETKEVVKEIPPEETIKMIDKIYELAGLIVDEKR